MISGTYDKLRRNLEFFVNRAPWRKELSRVRVRLGLNFVAQSSDF